MAWHSNFTYVPSNGPTQAGAVGAGWTDVGGRWSVTADNRLANATPAGGSPWISSTLSRLAAANATVGQRVQVRFTAGSDSDLWVILRQVGSGAAVSGIIASYNSAGWCQTFDLVGGNLSNNQRAQLIAPIAGSDYDIQVDCVQSDAASTTVTISLFTVQSASAALCSGTRVSPATALSVSTPALQNVSGGQGLFFYSPSGGTNFVKGVAVFRDSVAAATGLTISPSSVQQVVGVATAYTLAANGPIQSDILVSLDDNAAGGVISPSTVMLTNASPRSVFSYTAAAPGSVVLTARSGVLGSATANVTAVGGGTFLEAANPSVVLSPYNWTTGLANGAARTWNTGAYARASVVGTRSAHIVFGPTADLVTVAYQIDEGPVITQGVVSNGTIPVTLADTGLHTVTVWLNSLSQTTGRWSGLNALTLAGFQLGDGGVGAAASRGSKNLLIFGDSITEGIQANEGADGALYSFAWIVGESLAAGDWEYGIVACGSSGYSVAVGAGNGGTPAAFIPGNEGGSWWNKVDGTGGKRTIGTGAAERFSPQPDVILENWGTNDVLQGVGTATAQEAVSGLYQALRTAAPSALLLKLIPFGGYGRALVSDALLQLPPDARRMVCDLGVDGRIAGYASDGVHPRKDGHSRIAGLVLRAVLSRWPGASYAGGFHPR